MTNTRLAHPAIEVPARVSFDEKGDAKIDLDASALLSAKKDDGSFAWISYGLTRTAWRKEKFARTFPQEKAYRHSLAEEADALRSVLAAAAGGKDTKQLSPSPPSSGSSTRRGCSKPTSCWPAPTRASPKTTRPTSASTATSCAATSSRTC